MAARIRLARRGRKKRAIYDIVVADSRSPRDGKFIEKLGTYNPNTHPTTIILHEDRALDWLMKGALPSETTRVLLSKMGVMLRKHLQIGVQKGAIDQDTANSRFDAWKAKRDTTNLVSKSSDAADQEIVLVTTTSQKNAAIAKAEAEAKVAIEKAAVAAEAERAAAEKAAAEAPVAVAEEAVEETVAPEEGTAPADAPTEEAPVAEPEAGEEEAPKA